MIESVQTSPKNEDIASFLMRSRNYQQKMNNTHSTSEVIQELLEQISEEVNTLHMKYEEQELEVFRLGFNQGYNKAVGDYKRRLKLKSVRKAF